MTWSAQAREERVPEVQRGWEIVGSMVRRRRTMIRWSQRDLERASGVDQTVISRLETDASPVFVSRGSRDSSRR